MDTYVSTSANYLLTLHAKYINRSAKNSCRILLPNTPTHIFIHMLISIVFLYFIQSVVEVSDTAVCFLGF